MNGTSDPIEGLCEQWLLLLPEGLPAEAAQAIFEKLLANYSARGRHYHNLTHLDELFRHFAAFKHQLIMPNLVRAAIFFHDVIYRPSRRDNEVRSAERAAADLARIGFPLRDIQTVQAFILTTQHHQIPPGEAHPDLPWLLDFDLAILGAEADVYAEYARNIRREYRIYPDLLYRPGRRRVLEQLLGRPRLYHTAPFFDRFETPARENLRREIAALS